ncbi:hypothetical protein LOTGIDRAFT_229134 [Lottia gigantea]|uniref:Sodium/potassium-transporting ATPase subunit beta n=1 Tax=Lottia gigantea TaxID=225164 RepID=V3ZDQ2_LOTGI|nr:hypothetical protein LOTGIDRAFT_229134 [Lottia gigantea]ESO89248.1 hypothetical protein LOTGIDRAFT_229134 [Lottia gigantea]
MSGGYVAVTKASLTNDFDPDNVENIQFYRPRRGGFSLKNICDCLRNQSLLVKGLIGFAIVFGIIMTIIIVMSVKRSSSPEQTLENHSYPNYRNKKYGLQFYPQPEDESILINFRPMTYASYKHYYNMLNGILHDYNILNQQNPEKYVDCSDKNAPGDKVCKFPSTKLGKCTTNHEYGYHEGNPCVLFKLMLPPNMKPTSALSGKSELGERWSSNSIGISCKGQTPEDDENIGKKYLKNIPPIQYFPSAGFPTFYYRHLNNGTEFLDPLVMVKFNTVADHHFVNIECKAWLEDIDGLKSEDFISKFAFYIH